MTKEDMDRGDEEGYKTMCCHVGHGKGYEGMAEEDSKCQGPWKKI